MLVLGERLLPDYREYGEMEYRMETPSKRCGICKHYRPVLKCAVGGKVTYTNVCWNCPLFDGEPEMVDWDKATPVGYRPSTFSGGVYGDN